VAAATAIRGTLSSPWDIGLETVGIETVGLDTGAGAPYATAGGNN